jgi:hypothetical protein
LQGSRKRQLTKKRALVLDALSKLERDTDYKYTVQQMKETVKKTIMEYNNGTRKSTDQRRDNPQIDPPAFQNQKACLGVLLLDVCLFPANTARQLL